MIGLIVCCGVYLHAQPKTAGKPKIIAEMNEPLRLPVWSPDGTKLAMTSVANDGIWIIDNTGKNFRQITADKGSGYQLKWSPDNNGILARTSILENNRIFHEVKVYNTEDGKEDLIVPKTRDLKGLPFWSEDNSQVEYKVGNLRKSSAKISKSTSSADNKIGSFLLKEMIENPTTVASSTPGLKQLKSHLIFNPVLSPKGDKIVFQANDGKGLYICNATGSELMNLGIGERASWMPDNKYIIVSQTQDNGNVITKGELICIDTETGARATLLSSDNYIAVTPAVSPNGKKLAFEDYKSGAIYLVDLK